MTPAKTPLPVTASQSTKGEQGTPSGSTASPAANSPTAPGSVKGNTAPGTVLLQPTGDFVGAHKNVSVNASLSSVCNTSSGAKCQIIFTAGTTVHQLAAQTTDAGGATYWPSWTPASIGLTPGSWQVKAVATLNGQTQSSTDALNLEIVQ